MAEPATRQMPVELSAIAAVGLTASGRLGQDDIETICREYLAAEQRAQDAERALAISAFVISKLQGELSFAHAQIRMLARQLATKFRRFEIVMMDLL
jgi:hypothetical protein